MRAFVGLLLAALVAIGTYYIFLKRAAPTAGATAIQEISTTGVEMDLLAIAQAERMYQTQNGGYGSMEQLLSTGTMNINANGRGGYTYTATASSTGFLVTASHPLLNSPGVAPLRYPTISIDESMQIHRE